MADDDGRSKLWRPSSKWLLGIPLGAFIAFGIGAVALGAFNFVLHETSTNEFCYVCHSHDAFIRPEYEASSHFTNAAGVRAHCADCHLPHDNWFDLVATKVVVSFDIIPELMGELDTAEKYEEHRAGLASEVWRQLKENDSRFCRSCHSFEAMDMKAQDRFASRRHSRAVEGEETCIDCHYGIVHRAPDDAEDILAGITADLSGEGQDAR